VAIGDRALVGKAREERRGRDAATVQLYWEHRVARS
jgi:hypothetical protein